MSTKFEERRDRIAARVATAPEGRLQLIEDVLNLDTHHLQRVRTLVRNQLAIAEVARLMRMFNNGSFE